MAHRILVTALVLFAIMAPLRAHKPITTKVTWNKEISRIFAKHCTGCHRDGGAAFSLESYEDARNWAVAIRDEVLQQRMPPWGAAKGYGHFRNDRSLSAWEMELIVSWAEGGTPRAEPGATSTPVPAPETPPAPDLPALTHATHAAAAGSGPAAIAPIILKDGESLRRPLAIQDIELRLEKELAATAWLESRGSRVFLGSWVVPGDRVRFVEPLLLPAGATFRLEGAGSAAVYPASALSGKQAAPRSITVRGSSRLARAARILAVQPAGAQDDSIEVTAYRPDRTVETLVWVRSFDATYPFTYWLRQAVRLPAGTRVVVRSAKPAHARLILVP